MPCTGLSVPKSIQEQPLLPQQVWPQHELLPKHVRLLKLHFSNK